MSTFPSNAQIGDEYNGYIYDGTSWNLIGNEFNPTSFSATEPTNPKPGDLWVDSNENVDILDSTTLATKSYVDTEIAGVNIDLTTEPVYLMNSGTEAERPLSASVGMFRYNTDSGNPEWYSDTYDSWYKFQNGPEYIIEYLVVAGGGGGGGAYIGGGGGAGGYLSGLNTVTPGAATSITVGAGGSPGGTSNPSPGTSGTNSIFGQTTAIGGGGGGARAVAGLSGGSGGGSGANGTPTNNYGSGTSGQGNRGGAGRDGLTTFTACGGGGGAGAVGGDAASDSTGGSGGIGLQWSNGVYYAGGGGGGTDNAANGLGGYGGTGGTGGGGTGGSWNGSIYPSAGTANTGGGGGGGGRIGGVGVGGAAGGSGIVIIRYPGTQRGNGGNITYSGGYTYHTFTTSGSFIA